MGHFVKITTDQMLYKWWTIPDMLVVCKCIRLRNDAGVFKLSIHIVAPLLDTPTLLDHRVCVHLELIFFHVQLYMDYKFKFQG